MNHSIASAGQDLGQIQRVAPPTLESRLRHLHDAVDRVSKIRARLECIADAICVDPTNTASQGAGPPSNDLSGRFGDALGYLHTNLGEIERLAQRLDSALFEPKPAQSEARRG